ncbi:MAG: hypothetical protein ACRD20_20570 [Terriglobales bacterium]
MTDNLSMGDFDWVTARHECSLVKAFVQLKRDLEKDAAKANELFKGNRKYTLTQDAYSLTVTEEHFSGEMRSVGFALNDEKTAVRVSNERDESMFEFTVTLNKKRHCVFLVNGEEMESWEVRQKALNSLLFLIRVRSSSGFSAV